MKILLEAMVIYRGRNACHNLVSGVNILNQKSHHTKFLLLNSARINVSAREPGLELTPFEKLQKALDFNLFDSLTRT